MVLSVFFFFKQKTAYELRISDWSSDVCSSDLADSAVPLRHAPCPAAAIHSSFRAGAASMPMSGRPALISATETQDRKSVVEGKSVSVRVDLGGRRIVKNINRNTILNNNSYNKTQFSEYNNTHQQDH